MLRARQRRTPGFQRGAVAVEYAAKISTLALALLVVVGHDLQDAVDKTFVDVGACLVGVTEVCQVELVMLPPSVNPESSPTPPVQTVPAGAAPTGGASGNENPPYRPGANSDGGSSKPMEECQFVAGALNCDGPPTQPAPNCDSETGLCSDSSSPGEENTSGPDPFNPQVVEFEIIPPAGGGAVFF